LFIEDNVVVVTSICRMLARVVGCILCGRAVLEVCGIGMGDDKLLRGFSSTGIGDADNGTT
jgi:hypothetical protein